MNKHRIISWKLPLLLFIYFCINVIVILIYCNFSFLKEYINISDDILENIIDFQVNISLISITIMILFLEIADHRIMGMSYKKVFFKDVFFPYFNITNCIYLMLISMVISLCSYNFLINVENCISLIGKIVCETTLYCSIIVMFYMITLGFILQYKKSRIYYIVYKKLKRKDRKIYNEIINKLVVFTTEQNSYQQYIKDEFFIFSYIFLNIDDFESDDHLKQVARSKIINRINNMVKNDLRNNFELLVILYKYAEKTFGKEKANELFWYN